jgi:hypothetical protein
MVIIAEIEDDALLGLDILMKGEGGPADIKLTEGIILLNKIKIPCINRMCLNKIRMRFYQEILWLSKIISFKSINKYINNHFSFGRNNTKPVTWPTNAGIIRNLSKKGTTDGGKSGVVPHHLINLYNEAAAGRTTGEQEEILHLLFCITSIYGVLYQMGQS